MDEELERQLAALTPAQRALFDKMRGAGSPPAARLTDTEATGDYELSFAQQRFWLLEQLHPGEPAHHLCGVLDLTGALDRDALQRAVDSVLVEYETLRTCFVAIDERPRARIVADARLDLPYADVQDLAPDEQRQRIAERTHACTRQPFDLTTAPLLRAQLVRTAAEGWQLIWCVHHIAADGLSMLHLVHRLIELYGYLAEGQGDGGCQDSAERGYLAGGQGDGGCQDSAEGEGAAASPTPTRYHDFARWQQERDRGEEFDEGLRWYEARLRELPTTRLLPDHDGRDPEGARERLPLPRELGQALLQLARDAGCTPFVVMLTGFAAAMRRWLGTDDLVFGTPFANRPEARLQRAVGLFVNSVVLRLQVDDSTSFRDLLGQVRALAATAFRHGDVPFERLVQHLAPERNLDRNPIFQSMFNYVDFAEVDARPAGMHWRYREAPAGTLFDFTMYVRRRAQTFELEIEYDRSLFFASTMQRRLQELATLLHDAVLEPEQPLHRLRLLTPERTAELARCERGAPLPAGPSDALALIRSVTADDDAIALADQNTTCRRRELLALVERVGSALAARGVRPDDRVALLLPRGHRLPIAALACFHAGATVVPLDTSMPSQRLAAILARARPRCLLTAGDDALPIAGDAERLRFEDLVAFSGDTTTPAPGTLAYLQFTSGSTGEPKGVLVPHTALASLLQAMRGSLPIAAGDVLLSITSPSFDIAWLEWLLPLCVGARVHVADDQAARDGRALGRLLQRTGATFLQATPSTCRLLLQAGMPSSPELHLLVGGEALPDELAQQLRRRVARLWNVYGPTETTIWSTIHEVGNGPVRIGRPIPGTDAFVVDARGQRVPIGCQGELLLAGAGVSRGYDGLPEATAARFTTAPTGEPAYNTGDLVRWCDDGQLQFFGRADEQVKVRGHRLELGAIEAWLAEHPAVAECAVQAIGASDARDLAAHVVPVADPDANDGSERAASWQQVWHRAYRDGELQPGALDTRGWRDGRTGEPFAAATMQRFAAATARRIRSLRPRQVLEVGCGTGLIVGAAAGDGASWLATDPSPAAVDAVRRLVRERGLQGVTTDVLAADGIGALPAGSFDCVVINSVAQYFPDLQYLLDVLASARNLLADGGVLFVGDVRLRDWHGAQCAWLELHGSEPARPRAAFADAVARRLQREPELLVDARLFETLVARGAFADCWLAVRAGDDDTEMDRFRIDVALAVDGRFATAGKLPAPADNRRLAASWHAFEARADERTTTVAELRAHAARRAEGAGEPAAASELPARTPTVRCRAPLPPADELAAFANVPRRDRSELQAQLREHLRGFLPTGLLPSSFTFHDRLPRLPSGKLDRSRLRADAPTASATPPRTATERRLAELFESVLEVPRVGRDDDFFALGGHSLLAARLVARVADAFAVDVGLRDVFAAPRLQQLAATIDGAAARGDDAPRALARSTFERPGATMQRLWLQQRLLPGSRAYLMVGLVEVHGELTADELQHAVDAVVRRHEVLQLAFAERDGEPVLRRRRPFDVAVQRCQSADELQAELARMTGDALQALQVLSAPIDAHSEQVAFVLHHAFADGWSIHVLQRDLLAIVRAARDGGEPQLPDLPLQYLDFAGWQREGSHHDALAHFERELHGAPGTLDLPTDRERPQQPAEPGGRIALTMPDELQAQLVAFAREQNATAFHVVLATVQVWLARLSGQRDFVLGTTVANRDHREFEHAIGCFVQTLPLRCRIADDSTVTDHLLNTRDAFLQALEHRDVPMRELLERLDTPRLLHRAPLFQVTFDWLAFEWLGDPDAPTTVDDLTFVPVPYDPDASKFELSLVVTRSQPFAGHLEFRRDLFDRRTVQAWWHALLELLRATVASPGRRLAELRSIDAERGAELRRIGRGEPRSFAHRDVVSAWHRQVAQNPTAVAIRSADEALTFAAAQRAIAGIVADLQRDGVGPGARVGLCLPRSPAQLLAMHAVLQCGAAYVPIDAELPAARIRTMLRTAAADLLVCADPDDDRFCELPTRRLRLVVDCAAERPVDPIDSAATPPPNALAYVLFTSGSTGEPKGVAVSHAALANYAQWAAEHYRQPRSAALHTPLGFDLSLTSLWPVWCNGGSVFVAAPGDGIEPLLEAARHGPFDLVKLTPSHLRAWLATVPDRLDALARGLVVGGERLDRDGLAALRAAGVRIWNEYGPTEATVGCSCAAVGDEGEREPITIGEPIANARLYVLDAERRLVPIGVVGELWIAGAGLADGYLGEPALDGERFVADPFAPGERMYRSGDRASWTANGRLRYHGRADEQLKIRGHRIEPAEVRTALLTHPGVRQVVVTARTAPSGSEQLVAFVLGSFDEHALHDHVAARLPAAAVPSRIVRLDELPFDGNGKVDHARLPSPWTAARPTEHGAYDDATRTLTAIAARLLGVEDLHPDDDFFRSGGDSILALQLVAHAATAGLELAVRDVFEHPRMATLRRVARQPSASAPATPTEGPLLPMQAWWLRQAFAEPDRYDQAVVLRCRREVEDDELQRALAQLVVRHPALRSCIEVVDGAPRQRVLAAGSALAWSDEARFATAAGRVFAAALRSGADGQRLYLRAHHIAVDAVSWHVLVRELDALLAGSELPPPPLPPIAMAAWLRERHAAGTFADDVAFFRDQVVARTDDPAGEAEIGTEGQAVVQRIAMSVETTDALLAAERGRHRVRMQELLLAAASLAAARTGADDDVAIDVEGHGRDLAGAPDVARTVGWFTAVFPLRFRPLAGSLAEHIRDVKERVRSLPNGGVAALLEPLPASAILCNYLGVLDAGGDDGEVLSWCDDDPGALRAPNNRRSHSVEVRAEVHADRLHVAVHTNDVTRSRAFANAIEAALHELIDTCANANALPSAADHPLARLPREQLLPLLAGRDDVDAVYPLTPTQQGMLFSSLQHPHEPIYREQLTAELVGPLDAEALALAFDEVAQRHELLRGEVHWRGLDEPHWVIRTRPTVTLLLPTGTSTSNNPREIWQVRMRGQRGLPFLFGENPLLRALLLRFEGQVHTLLLTYHHVVLDGWSMPRLLAEIVHRYRVHLGERLPPLPPPRPFAEHVALLARQDATEQRSFWRERLQGFAEPTPLPGDQDELDDSSFDECELWLSAEAHAQLREATQRDGITSSTLVQAAWALLLARWSERDDVLFGVTVAGRAAELDDIADRIGLFINTIPLRVRVGDDTDRVDWLRATQAELAELLQHQHTPLPVSQAESDVPAGMQPFDSLVVFENYPIDAAMRELPGGLEVRATDAFERTNYALTLVAIPGDRMCLRLLHARRFSATFAERLLQCVARILDQLTRPDSLPLAELDWQPPELTALAREHAIGPAAPAREPVPTRIRRQAERTPDRPAIVDGERTVSYRELVATAEGIARRLCTVAGCGPDALVAFDGDRRADAIATLLGIWWSGAAYLPIDPEWPAERVADILAAARPIAVLPEDLDEAKTSSTEPVPIANDSLAYAIATSGTTGTPKIVRIEHGALANYVAAAEQQFALTPDDRVLQFASFAFDTAAEEIWPTLCAGATLVLRRPDQADSSAAFVRAAHRQRTTIWDLPTAFFGLLTQTELDVPKELRLCIVGGQAVSRGAVERFRARAPGVQLWNTYGPSEATIVATWSDLATDGDDRRTPPIGRPVPGCEAWVVDRHGHPRLPGMPGELQLAGKGLARDYCDSDQTGRSFVRDPITGQRRYRTGDIACVRDDGQLTFLGRRDRQLKIAGVRIELHAIEARLQQHPDVVEAVVVARQLATGTQLVAFVEAERSPEEAELIRFARRRLPRQAVPATIVVHPQLPRLVSGKVDHGALQLPAAAPRPQARPRDDDQSLMLAIFAELFERDDLGIDDDFFELGGDSLLAVRLLDLVRDRTSIELRLQSLFADPTPRGMARALRMPADPEPCPHAEMRADAQLPDSFAVAPGSSWRRPRRVLVTGATGFFGRYALRELLRTDVERVYCLVRASDDDAARRRIDEALARTATPPDERVVAVRGDLTSADALDQLAEEPLVVVHAAAFVDFLRPYSALRAANVFGTRNLVMACARFGWTLHHVSSIGVFSQLSGAPRPRIDEHTELDPLGDVAGGYAQSKFVAERLVRAALDRGLPGAIHRPGRLIADRELGRGNESDFVTAMLHLVHDLGLAVVWPGSIDLTPVDYAARELTALLFEPAAAGGSFHLVNPAPTPVRDLVAMWRAAGIELQATDWPTFRQRAVERLRELPDHPARQLLLFLQVPTDIAIGAEPWFTRAATDAVLGDRAEPPPTLDPDTMQRWLRTLLGPAAD